MAARFSVMPFVDAITQQFCQEVLQSMKISSYILDYNYLMIKTPACMYLPTPAALAVPSDRSRRYAAPE